jgi:hypothetical protein
MRRQVPGNRRAEHPVADDQEVHDDIIPLRSFAAEQPR